MKGRCVLATKRCLCGVSVHRSHDRAHGQSTQQPIIACTCTNSKRDCASPVLLTGTRTHTRSEQVKVWVPKAPHV